MQHRWAREHIYIHVAVIAAPWDDRNSTGTGNHRPPVACAAADPNIADCAAQPHTVPPAKCVLRSNLLSGPPPFAQSANRSNSQHGLPTSCAWNSCNGRYVCIRPEPSPHVLCCRSTCAACQLAMSHWLAGCSSMGHRQRRMATMPYQPPAGNADVHDRTTGELLQELLRLQAEAAKQVCRPCAAIRHRVHF